MKLPALLLGCLCILTLPLHAAEKNAFALERGVNISHWLSQRGEMPRELMQTYFTEFDVIMLSEAGFDHIRIPIDEVEFWDDDGRPREDAWAFLEQALGWAERHGLRAIVDLHIIRSHYFNAANEGMNDANTLWEDPAEQEKFVQLWEEISDRIGSHPVDWVAYEFMNEAVGSDHEDWNKLLRAVYGRIRELEPQRTFVLGSFNFQSMGTLDQLWVPEGDPNLVISFHNYDPFLVTHHMAEWNRAGLYKGPIQYPGKPVPDESLLDDLPEDVREAIKTRNQPFSYETILKTLQPAVDCAKKHNLPVYCGEWGCIIYAPREIRLAYYRDWIRAFRELGISQAIWDYQGHFRIVNPRTRVIDHELIDILTREGPAVDPIPDDHPGKDRGASESRVIRPRHP